MKFLIFVVIVVCMAVSSNEEKMGISDRILGVELRESQSRIISGFPAEYGQFPWQVAINIYRDKKFFCGGALISPVWVLTAAHCTNGSSSSTLHLGDLNQYSHDAGCVDVNTSYYIVHPNYGRYLNNDIALIKLEFPVTLTDRIKTIRLPSRGEVVRPGVKLTVSGWGYTTHDKASVNSPTLNYVELTSISNPVCAWNYIRGAVISSTLCCRGDPRESVCHGDSGGPLVSIKNGVATLVGVISFIHPDGCASGKPSGYVRTESFLSWIRETTGISV